jgi:hypothetical protein
MSEPNLIGIFDNRARAEGAIDALRYVGFEHEQIGIVTPGGVAALSLRLVS